jgi:hypothetical protein
MACVINEPCIGTKDNSYQVPPEWERFIAIGTFVIAGGLTAAVNSAGVAQITLGVAAFAACVRRAPAGAARIGYQLLIGALAISVVVGSTLGDAAPAGWLR